MNTAVIDAAMPAAYLVGRPRPRAISPGHQRIDDTLQHVTNTAVYDNRTRVQVAREGWDFGSVKGAIVWAMYRAAVTSNQNRGSNLDEYAHLLDDVELHPFTATTLAVDGIAHPALELHRFGVVVRAAVVEGWTVLACVPESQDPTVEFAENI
jgi:hypothetical protein